MEAPTLAAFLGLFFLFSAQRKHPCAQEYGWLNGSFLGDAEKQSTTKEYTISSDDKFNPETHVNWNLLPRKDKCSSVANNKRIIGGQQVPMGSYPWIAHLAYSSAPAGSWGYGSFSDVHLRYLCGGSLISQYYVLTAGHCVHTPGFQMIHARVGEHNTETDPDCETIGADRVCAPPVQDIRVDKLILHEQFNGEVGSRNYLKNDIALVHLATSPILNPYVQPVCLPLGLEMTMKYTGHDTVVAGWGLTEAGTLSHRLLAVTQVAADPESCIHSYDYLYGTNINYSMGQMCVGGVAGKDSCGGDSGGPLMYTGTFDSSIGARTYLIGLVSLGPEECGKTEYPGIYTRTSYFMKWILDHMEE